jgi:hypothetical protein
MSGIADIAVGAGTAAVVAALAWTLVLAWRSATREDSALPIFRALGRAGLATESFESEARAVDLAHAVRTCAFCDRKAQCRAALDSGDGRGFLAFCPNASFLERAAGR